MWFLMARREGCHSNIAIRYKISESDNLPAKRSFRFNRTQKSSAADPQESTCAAPKCVLQAREG
jgi:hypothetical protein